MEDLENVENVEQVETIHADTQNDLQENSAEIEAEQDFYKELEKR